MHTHGDQLADLIAQLGELKFGEFFRHLIDDERFPTEAISLPKTKMYYMLVGELGFQSWSRARLYQIAHMPTSLNQRDFVAEFFGSALEDSLREISQVSYLRGTLGAGCSYRPGSAEAELHQRYEAGSEGTLYYFVTNVRSDLLIDHESMMSEYVSSIAEEKFTEILGVSLKDGFRTFGVGTPDTIVKTDEGRAKAVATAAQLLNRPDDYYLIARDSRVVVCPFTEHGLFFATGGKVVNGVKA